MRRSVPLSRWPPDATGAGLAAAEVQERRRQYGANDILEATSRPWWEIFRDTARDPMLGFLLATGVLYAVLGELAEAATLLVAAVPLAGMDAFLHRRTQASTAGLKSRLAVRARVIRGGVELEVPAEEVVPGDLVVVLPDEPFPADGIIVGGAEQQVDESTLTGESFPVRKHAFTDGLSGGPEVAVDAEHWGMAGTRLLTGRALLRVVFTGADTVYGEIVRSARSSARERTPLQMAIARLVSVLVAAALVMCLILAVVRLRQGYGWVDALVSAATLAVAALPEEFPVVFTFFLGVGVYRLARRQALVRRAVSVENIGRVSCICSDKTGTITEGRLDLTHLVPAADVPESRLLALAVQASRRDSNDPLDTAIRRAAAARGTPPSEMEVVAVFPFSERSRRETIAARAPGATPATVLVATKGTPETILRMARVTEGERALWTRRAAELAGEAHKVVACAWRSLEVATWAGDEPQYDYCFAGLLGFEDPVRDGVAHAIAACRAAGIHTIMVTGDHPLTARAVAHEIGLSEGEPRVVSAEEMEARVAGTMAASIREIDVVARAVPAQKLALVRALQRAGEVVAVTGDGVNDVPALQAADIGFAMGERGTRSAREVAAIVLLDDNFRTIVGAIREGQQLFRNLRLSFEYLLMVHIPLVLTAALIPLAGYPVLYLPVHVIWLELIIHPTALLVFQDLAGGGLMRPARQRTARFFGRGDWLRIVMVGGLVTLLVGAGYARSLGALRNVEHARAMALAVLTIASAALTAGLSRLGTRTARVIVTATLALSLLLIQSPTLAALLHLQPLHLDDWAAAAAGALAAATPVLLRSSRARNAGG
jgi:Ca2+-transporting ATPase